MNTKDPKFPLSDIGQIGLTVSDLEKAVAFYRDTLGLKHLFSAPPGLAFFDVGNVRLMLSCPEKPDSERFTSALYFKVCGHQSDARRPCISRSHFRGRTAPGCEDAGSRIVDGIFPRHRPEPAGLDVRTAGLTGLVSTLHPASNANEQTTHTIHYKTHPHPLTASAKRPNG